MKRLRRWGIVVLLVGFVLTTLAWLFRQDPMLLHVLADSSCACSDYDEEVSGMTVLNPFRDRLPEISAKAFLEDIKQGRCPVMASDVTPAECGFLMKHRRVSEWKLISRRDKPRHRSLYYKLTKLGSEPRFRFTGVGFIEVVEVNGAWKVCGFDAEF